MSEMRRLLSFVRRAVDDYDMIEEGDKIARIAPVVKDEEENEPEK